MRRIARSLLGQAIVMMGCAVQVPAQNLVPNGDFELHTSCPSAPAQIDAVIGWTTASGGSPDHFNTCATDPMFNVPDNWLGTQVPHSGDAYAGIVAFAGAIPDYREYIEVPLSNPLVQGACYRVSLYLNLARMPRSVGSDIGIHLSDTTVSVPLSYEELALVPQVENTAGWLNDTTAWVEVAGLYEAHGGESFLVIGNFKDDASSDLQLVDSSLVDLVYYFIDDVSVIQVSCTTSMPDADPFNAQWCALDPVSGQLRIGGFGAQPCWAQVFDASGRVCWSGSVPAAGTIDLPQLAPGVHVIHVLDQRGTVMRSRFVHP